MNERIKELANETTKWVLENTDNFPMPSSQWNDKFAELIVRECAEVSENYAAGSMPLSIAHAIKKHFGVES